MHTQPITISREKHSINITPHFIHFSAGLNRLFASVMWVNTLIESDIERNANKDQNSWMFFRFLTIAQFDPFFIQNTQYGGQYLSIVKDDLKGAEVIFKKGLEKYPNDYFLNYNLAFLYFSEFKNAPAALPYLLKVKDNILAPKFIIPLIGTIMEKSSVPLEDILYFVKEERKENDNPFYDDLYKVKIKQLEEKLKK